jgi:recombination protein RecT
MNQVARHNQFAELRAQLDRQLSQFAAVLPAHIPAERFARVILTAVQNTPELLDCDRRSLLNSCMRAAQDGLMPDGRLGAMVVYKDRRRNIKTVQWLPMIAGLRQKVRNSGEISDWHVSIVHENDNWDYEEGDRPHILHKPVRGDRGGIIAAYSIAHFRTGEISREWMWIEELDKVRAVSKAERGPWQDWPEEMYKKTVAKRHSKSLPMSTDLDDLLRRPDEPTRDESSAGGVTPLVVGPGQASPPAALAEALDQLAGPRSRCDHVWGAPFDGAVKCTKCGATEQAPDDFDNETGEVIDAGEYADSDDEPQAATGKP